MRTTNTTSTVAAMHVATGLLAVGIGQALQDGIERAAVLRQVDNAHAVGQAYYVRRLRERISQQDAEAEAAAVRLMANRRRLHG